MAGKQIWEKENPRSRHEKLTPNEKAKAKRAAEKAGRDQPALVDNINAKRNKKKKKKK